MSSKTAWSILLIAFGVLFFIGGVHGFYETHFHAYEVDTIGKVLEPHVGNIDTGVYVSNSYADIIFREKTKYIVFSLMGFATAILGVALILGLPVGKRDEEALEESDLDLIIQEDRQWVL